MPIVTATFERKTFRVQAIRVTAENMQELAEWTGGELGVTNASYDEGRPFVNVPVGHVNGRERLARAYVGNWITRLSEGNNFRVYKDKSFVEAFRAIMADTEKYAKVLELVKAAMREENTATYLERPDISAGTDEVITNKILELFAA